ncbi:MAG: DUF5130 family protein [Streptosporangiaceae bacterium]
MPAGDAFSDDQVHTIRRVLRTARAETGLRFSLHVGRAEGESRVYAQRLHAALGRDAPTAVLIAVDPAARRLEIVTGGEAQRRLDDRTCALAAMSMTTAFSVGDLVGGIISGVSMLADHARREPILHQEHPN